MIKKGFFRLKKFFSAEAIIARRLRRLSLFASGHRFDTAAGTFREMAIEFEEFE